MPGFYQTPTKKISFSAIVARPEFAAGMFDALMGEWQEHATITAAWTYERGRQFAICTGEFTLPRKRAEREKMVEKYRALRISGDIR